MINNIEQNVERIQRLKISCILNDKGRERYFHHGHEYIEIGGLKWATMNVGAEKVTDGGLYFQWGDTQGYTAEQVGYTESKKCFYWTDYKHLNYGVNTMSKYNHFDGKTVLDLEDDAARANWGGQWRMPTTEEFVALHAAVDAVWVKNYQGSGINGILCTAKDGSGAQLFFHACGSASYGSINNVGGYGIYWSSSLFADSPNYARRLYFTNGDVYWDDSNDRCYGYAVRCVVG